MICHNLTNIREMYSRRIFSFLFILAQHGIVVYTYRHERAPRLIKLYWKFLLFITLCRHRVTCCSCREGSTDWRLTFRRAQERCCLLISLRSSLETRKTLSTNLWLILNRRSRLILRRCCFNWISLWGGSSRKHWASWRHQEKCYGELKIWMFLSP